jgi:hypothetical protein
LRSHGQSFPRTSFGLWPRKRRMRRRRGGCRRARGFPRGGPQDRRRALRDGSADAPRSGSSPERRRPGGAVEPPLGRARTAPELGAEGRAGADGARGACPSRGRCGALAARGPEGEDRGALRGHPARAHPGQAAGGKQPGASSRRHSAFAAARLRPQHPKSDPAAQGVQKNFAVTVAEAPRGTRPRTAPRRLVPGVRHGSRHRSEAHGGRADRPAGHADSHPGPARHPPARIPREPLHPGLHLRRRLRPGRGATAALVMPWVDTQAVNAHLAGISRTMAEGAQPILVPDGAGWHGARALRVADTITLLPLPSCPGTRSGPDHPGLPARQPPRHLRLRDLRGPRRAVLRGLPSSTKSAWIWSVSWGRAESDQWVRCSILDEHISPRRSAFFTARSVLRDIRDGVRAC